MKFLLFLHVSVEISRKHVGNQIQKKFPKLKKYSPSNFEPALYPEALQFLLLATSK